MVEAGDIMNTEMLKIGSVELVPVTVEDAEFIFTVRQGAIKQGFLRKGADSPDAQRAWLVDYLGRQNLRYEHYFMICDKGRKCGTLRVQNLAPDQERFTWGSWCIAAGHGPYVAIGSYILANDVGFTAYNKPCALFEVHEENAGVIAFHRRMGACETGKKRAEQIEFSLSRDIFLQRRSAWASRLGWVPS